MLFELQLQCHFLLCLLRLKEDKETEHLICQTSQDKKYMQRSSLSGEARQIGPKYLSELELLQQIKHAVLSKLYLFHDSYAQSLASTRILKHSEQSSRGSCGENLAWASYDQSGAAFYYRFHVQEPVIYCTAHGQIQSVVWEREQLGCISPVFPL